MTGISQQVWKPSLNHLWLHPQMGNTWGYGSVLAAHN